MPRESEGIERERKEIEADKGRGEDEETSRTRGRLDLTRLEYARMGVVPSRGVSYRPLFGSAYSRVPAPRDFSLLFPSKLRTIQTSTVCKLSTRRNVRSRVPRETRTYVATR